MTAITFQNRVQPWLLACFGAEIAADKAERNHRFLEESLELVQSCGCTASEAHQLVDYVFGRPVGEPAQEAGGVMVTLAALCLANSLDMHEAGETELARIWTKVEAISAKQAAKPKHSPLPAAPAAVAPQGERQWICPTRTVADLVNNLLTMDQGLPVYCAQYIEKDGRRCAIAVPPTVSRERVLDGRWIGQGEELNAAVVWTRAEQPAAVAGPALDVTLDEDQAGLLRDMLGDPAEYPEAITVRLLVGDGHSGHGLYVAQAEYQDEGAVLLSSLPAPAAPALEAPAAPALPAAYQGGMFATTPDGGTVTLRFSDASAGEQWFERLTDGFDALAAAPQAPRLGEDALHLLRRLLSNQHTLTGPEFRAELEKIVAEESARHAAAPQAPAAPVGLSWRTGIPPWTDDRSVRVIAVTAQDDFGGVQVHDIRAIDFHTDGDGDGAEVARVCTHWAYRDDIWPRAAAAAPAAAIPWDNFPSYLIDHCEGQTITEEGLQRALAAMLANPQYATAAPGAPAVDADPLGLRDVGEALLETIERNADALKAAGWTAPMDCPSEIVVDLLNLLDEAKAAMSQAARDVLAERRRQVEAEGYDTEHDDAHVMGEIGALAALYLMPDGARDWDTTSTTYGATLGQALLPEDWTMPTMGEDRRRDLVKGVACGLAELERWDRASAQTNGGNVT